MPCATPIGWTHLENGKSLAGSPSVFSLCLLHTQWLPSHLCPPISLLPPLQSNTFPTHVNLQRSGHIDVLYVRSPSLPWV